MKLNYTQCRPYDGYFNVGKPKGDAAVDLRALEIHALDMRGYLPVINKMGVQTGDWQELGADYIPGYGEHGLVWELKPNTMHKIYTGVNIHLGEGYEGKISLRSSSGLLGLVMPNAPGLIDSHYTGELIVPVLNPMPYSIYIAPGGRFAQLSVLTFEPAELILVTELAETERGSKGFGSTGA